MRSRRLFLGFILAALVPLGAAAQRAPGPVPEASWVRGGDLRLHLRAFKGNKLSNSPILVIVLHGDAPGKRPGQQDAFAAQAATGRDVVAIGLLRPGYTDLQGNTSEGRKGRMNGDNYDARNTDAIASAIGSLKRRHHSRKVVLAGHSGGAALAANILGRHPALVDAALLVSCPCDVPAWRQNMFQLTKRPESRPSSAWPRRPGCPPSTPPPGPRPARRT
ncbi:MAG: alpha/beta hydrolase [Holophaga sp.]|nr:alpha/beta hydrolase [Holophaga sp.]